MEPKETRWSLETNRCFHVLNRAIKSDNYSPVPQLFTKRGFGFQKKEEFCLQRAKKKKKEAI